MFVFWWVGGGGGSNMLCSFSHVIFVCIILLQECFIGLLQLLCWISFTDLQNVYLFSYTNSNTRMSRKYWFITNCEAWNLVDLLLIWVKKGAIPQPMHWDLFPLAHGNDRLRCAALNISVIPKENFWVCKTWLKLIYQSSNCCMGMWEHLKP